MASLLKAAAGKVSGTGTPSNEPASESDVEEVRQAMGKYLLSITAGPSYDLSTHSPVSVNTDKPTLIENEYLTAKIKVRIRGYDGLPRGSQFTSAYFEDPAHTADQWSIGFSFVPKVDLPADQTVFGTTFEHPVRDRLPPKTLVDMGWKIFKSFVDPGVEADFHADRPFLLGPTLSTWFVFRVGEKLQDGQDPREHAHPSEKEPVQEGADGESANQIREEFGMPTTWAKRRKHFLQPRHREGFIYEKDRLYTGDFHNPYIDFAQFKVKLPGLSISVAKYINDKTHVLRWVFLNKETQEVYFVVCFTLLHGGDVDRAVERDEERVRSEGAGKQQQSQQLQQQHEPQQQLEQQQEAQSRPLQQPETRATTETRPSEDTPRPAWVPQTSTTIPQQVAIVDGEKFVDAVEVPEEFQQASAGADGVR